MNDKSAAPALDLPEGMVPMRNRFRGFCPVVVDVETGGFNAQTDALLEVAAVSLSMDENFKLHLQDTQTIHIQPFENANMEPASLEINGIDPYHPLRIALPEKEALKKLFKSIRQTVRANFCKRAILVGHNAFFDLNFLNAAIARTGVKSSPFHPFSNLDTVTLGAMAYGQTVLSRMAQAANMEWSNESAHSAAYDAEKTAELFCNIVNTWQNEIGWLNPTPEEEN